MEQLRGYKTNCGFSLGRPRLGSLKVKIPNIKPLVAENRKEIEENQVEKEEYQVDEEEEEEEEAKSIDLEDEEEEEDHGAKNMDLEEGEVEEEEKKHICCECGKGFKSGKALGGHKRIHVLENRKFSMVRPKMESGLVGRSEGGELEAVCCVCHKKFTSMKALYGHMRFHPDRGWKGVFPPPHPFGNSSSSTLSVDDHDDEFISSDYDAYDDYDDDDDDDENSELWEMENGVDLKESIIGWGKRGRRSGLNVDESDLKDPRPSEDLKEFDAKNLLVLADTAEAETSNSHSVEDTMKKRKKKKKSLSEMEKESSSTHHDDHLQLAVVVSAAEERGGGAREKHVCVTCNKSFTSYQALGGHRASHNKVKMLENNQARANNEALLLLGNEGTVTGLASAQGSNTSLSSNNNNGDHICNICHKSFTTGQALGGHKRCHWTGPVSTEAATAPAAPSLSQVTETVQEVKKLKRKFLEFDLNELPPNDEEDEERV